MPWGKQHTFSAGPSFVAEALTQSFYVGLLGGFNSLGHPFISFLNYPRKPLIFYNFFFYFPDSNLPSSPSPPELPLAGAGFCWSFVVVLPMKF